MLLAPAVAEAPKAAPRMAMKATGNSALDNAMSSLTMMGLDPELAEMMRQANEAEPVQETSAQKAKNYAYYSGGGADVWRW